MAGRLCLGGAFFTGVLNLVLRVTTENKKSFVEYSQSALPILTF